MRSGLRFSHVARPCEGAQFDSAENFWFPSRVAKVKTAAVRYTPRQQHVIPKGFSLLDVALSPHTDKAILRGIQNRGVLKEILIEHLADPSQRFNRAAFCRRYALTDLELRKWLRDPEINTKVRERINEVLRGGTLLASLYRKTIRRAMRGSHKDTKLLLEISGEYQPGVRLEHSIASPESRFKELENERKRGIRLIRPSGNESTQEADPED